MKAIRISVKRKLVTKVGVEQMSITTHTHELWEDRRAKVPTGTQMVCVQLEEQHDKGWGRLKHLEWFLATPGNNSFNPENVAKMFAHLGVPVVEVEPA